MRELIHRLQASFPKLKFVAGGQFYWSPESGEIFYKSGPRSAEADWSLLHETGHALLGHQTYQTDVELLHLEVAAWEKARSLAADLGMKIDEEHIEDCLDTYRDWLNQRSICPRCGTKCLQQNEKSYRCFNCHEVWQVSDNRFSRAYRRTQTVPLPKAVFLEKISAGAEILCRTK